MRAVKRIRIEGGEAYPTVRDALLLVVSTNVQHIWR